MAAILSLDRATLHYRRALMQVRYLLESSACPRPLREDVYKVIDDALQGGAKGNPITGKVHR